MENGAIRVAESDLYHHGTKGMKWGNRLYQNKDGSLTPLGRMRYGSKGDSSGGGSAKKKVSRKVRKQREAALEKARQAKAEKKRIEEEQKKHEEEKQQALKSGSASDLLKFKGEYNQQEMKYAWDRIQWEQNISNASAKEISAGKYKADKFFNNLKTGTEYAETAAKAWNTLANVNNAFNKDFILPKIDTNITNGNRKEWKADKKEREKAEEAKKKREEQEAQRESKHQERAEKKAQKEAEEKSKQENEKEAKAQQKAEQKTEKKVQKEADSKTDSGAEKVDGKVEWYDRSKASKYTEKEGSIIDGEFSEMSVSGVPAVVTNRGQSYVTALLEDTSRRGDD